MDWRLQWGLLDQAPASTALSLQVHWPRKTMRNGILVFSLLKKICSPTWNLRSIYKHLNRLSLSPQLKSNPTKLCVIALELLLCSTESGPVEQGQVCHQQQVWGEERAWWSPDTGHMQGHWTYTNSPTDPCQATLPHVELYKLWEYDWVNLRLSSSTLHHCNEAWEVTNSRPRQWNTLHQPNIPRNSSRSTAELSQMILLEYFQSGGQSGTIRHPAHLACLLRPEREENLSYCFIFSFLSISLRWWNIFEIFSTEQNPQTWHRERQSVLSD